MPAKQKRPKADRAVIGLIAVAAIVAIAIVFLVVSGAAASRARVTFETLQSGNSLQVDVISLGGYGYNVPLATNLSEWQQGLMNYTFACSVPAGCINGMLFVFPTNSTTCFWMKDTPEPLVQVWVANGTVTKVYNATPESTASICGTGNEVLELNSNLPINARVGYRLTQESGS